MGSGPQAQRGVQGGSAPLGGRTKALDPTRGTREEAGVVHDLSRPASLTAQHLERFDDDADLHALAEAATAAVLDGGGFGWVKPPKAASVEQYFKGVVLVPERALVVGRMDGVIYGSVQLHKPSRNNEAQAFAAGLMHHFVAPYARGHGLARMILDKAEELARGLGYQVLNLDVRETQAGAISLYEACGYERWGTHPAYARVRGKVVRGHFYTKMLSK